MPCGIPVWKNNLECVGLDSLFGFIEACVVCPTNISERSLTKYFIMIDGCPVSWKTEKQQTIIARSSAEQSIDQCR